MQTLKLSFFRLQLQSSLQYHLHLSHPNMVPCGLPKKPSFLTPRSRFGGKLHPTSSSPTIHLCPAFYS